jgi:hypothetical protein
MLKLQMHSCAGEDTEDEAGRRAEDLKERRRKVIYTRRIRKEDDDGKTEYLFSSSPTF